MKSISQFVGIALCVFLAFVLRGIAIAENTTTPITPASRIDLFNGKDFSGWTFCMNQGANPTNTWSVENAVIKCTGQPTGYLRTEKEYGDYKLTVEWRFVKVTPKANNTGVLVRIQKPDKVWPQCIQVQGKHEHHGDLFLMAGAESKEHRGMDANTPILRRGESNENPAGDWNTCEAVCDGNSVKAYINGKLANETTECTISSGAIGIQSEGGEIEIRKIYLEPLN